MNLPTYEVTDSKLVIKVDIEYLKHLIQNCGELENSVLIPDARSFAISMARYLDYDEEDGNTELYRCFDKVAIDMFENGEESIIEIR